MTRAFSVRFGLGLFLLGTLCVLAEPAQAGPFRRGGRGGGCGGCGSGGMVYSGGCGGGYAGGYAGGYSAAGCCGGMAYGGGSMYQPAMGMASGTTGCCGSGGVSYGGYTTGYGTQVGGYTSGVPYMPSTQYMPGGTYTQAGGVAYGGMPAGTYTQGGTLYAMPGTQYGGVTPAGGVGGTSGLPGVMPARGETTSVQITDDGFSPKTLNVTPNTTVRWKNDSKSGMTVTSDKGDWSSEQIPPGGEFTATFTQAGTFGYHCKEHKDMKGSVVVK